MRNLIFTAVGDRMPIDWIQPTEEIDFAVAYYGKSEERAAQLKSKVKWFQRGCGSKLQFFWSWYSFNTEELATYSWVGIFDDDISLRPDRILQMFRDLAEHNKENADIVVYSPSQCPSGKISHPIMKPHNFHVHCDNPLPGPLIRRSTFIEMTWPIFRTDFIPKYMQVYRTEIFGWGVDILWTKLVGELGLAMAVLDNYVSYNPKNTDTPHRWEPDYGAWKNFFLSRKIFGSTEEEELYFRNTCRHSYCCCCIFREALT